MQVGLAADSIRFNNSPEPRESNRIVGEPVPSNKAQVFILGQQYLKGIRERKKVYLEARLFRFWVQPPFPLVGGSTKEFELLTRKRMFYCLLVKGLAPPQNKIGFQRITK